MNPELGLRVLGSIMDWDDERANDEFAWLTLMARLKYDGYRDFEAGVRFIESLAAWLQQFEAAERPIAYDFVKHRLLYIGPGEMEKLVAQFYPNFVHRHLVKAAATTLGIAPYTVYANPDAVDLIGQLRRRTLFLGLSDGARVDYIRHQNVGRITNEQVVGSTQLDDAKWTDLLKELRKSVGDPAASFRAVYLIDDFAGTGTSFFRFDSESDQPKGKLIKFAESVREASGRLKETILAPDYELFIHHYIGTTKAKEDLGDRLRRASNHLEELGLPRVPVATFGITLPEWIPLRCDEEADQAFLSLVDKYYDPVLETRHTAVGGTTDMKLGYGACALPLVLDHNSPNNSVPLLWAQTSGAQDLERGRCVPAMRPLFRRRQRHV